MNSLRMKVWMVGVIAAVASVGMSAASPVDRVKSVDLNTSVNGQLDGGIGYLSINTDVLTTDGVTTTTTFAYSYVGGSCNASVYGAIANPVTVNRAGTQASASFSSTDYAGNVVDVTITAAGTQVFTSRIAGTIRATDGSTQKIGIVQDEVPITSSQVVISLNGTPCYTGGLNGSFINAETKVTVSTPAP